MKIGKAVDHKHTQAYEINDNVNKNIPTAVKFGAKVDHKLPGPVKFGAQV